MDLRENPIARHGEHRSHIVLNFQHISQVDGIIVTTEEREQTLQLLEAQQAESEVEEQHGFLPPISGSMAVDNLLVVTLTEPMHRFKQSRSSRWSQKKRLASTRRRR